MTLSDFASVGSLVSGIAVLISLIYLAVQVRQAEKNQRSLMNQGAVTRGNSSLALLTQPDLSDLFARAVAGESEFSSGEAYRLQTILRISMLSLQDHYVQHRAGLIDQITYDNISGGVRRLLTRPVFRALWIDSRMAYAPELRALADEFAADLPLADPIDLGAQLKDRIIELRGANRT
jgi:hypothetical protein